MLENKEQMARALSKDPYKNFRFKVFFDNQTSRAVAGVNKVSGLSWSVEVISHGSRKLPHKTMDFPPVTLSRGITQDEDFKTWAESVCNWYAQANPLKKMRKKVSIVLCNEKGEHVVQYDLEKCWVSKYETLPELSADGNGVAIESISLEHEGWQHKVC